MVYLRARSGGTMSASRRTSREWRALRQWQERKRYRAAGAIVEDATGGDPFKRWGHYPVGISALAGDVKVYDRDGILRKVVTAAEWRKRHGDPFKNQRREVDDARAEW